MSTKNTPTSEFTNLTLAAASGTADGKKDTENLPIPAVLAMEAPRGGATLAAPDVPVPGRATDEQKYGSGLADRSTDAKFAWPPVDTPKTPHILQGDVKAPRPADSAIKAPFGRPEPFMPDHDTEGRYDAGSPFKAKRIETRGKLESDVVGRDGTMGKVKDKAPSVQVTGTGTYHTKSVFDAVKQNPIPAALIGLGAVWMLASVRRSRRSYRAPGSYNSYNPTMEPRGAVEAAFDQVGDTAENVVHAIQRKAGDVAHQAGEIAEHTRTSIEAAGHSAVDTATHLALGAKDKVTSLVRDAREEERRIEQRVEGTFREHPLVIGAAVVAVGAVIGLAIPITRMEEEWMGELRDQVVRKAEVIAQGALEKVEDAAMNVSDGIALKSNGQRSSSSEARREL